VHAHAFSLAGGAEVQLQLFTASSQHGFVFKCTIRQLYRRHLNPRHPMNRKTGAPQKCHARFGCKKNLETHQKKSIPKLSVAQTNILSLHWTIRRGFSLIYKDEYLYVCLYLIQIHISEPIWTKLCTHLPRGLEETVGYIWARNSALLRTFGPFLGAQDGCRSDLFPRFPYIRGSSWCSRDVTDITLSLAAESSAVDYSVYPWF
jgi:hypothetical protein